jgi:hypothetical protein
MQPAPHKTITVIVPQGRGMALLEQLHGRGVLRAALGTARAPFTVVRRKRGISRSESFSVEKDVLNVVVPEPEADALFAFLYDAARIGESHGGFMFQGLATQASEFALPGDLPGPR